MTRGAQVSVASPVASVNEVPHLRWQAGDAWSELFVDFGNLDYRIEHSSSGRQTLRFVCSDTPSRTA